MISYDEEDAEAVLELGLIVAPSLLLIGQAGVLAALFVMLPVVYGVDQTVHQISLFDPIRGIEIDYLEENNDDGNEVVEAERVDEK